MIWVLVVVSLVFVALVLSLDYCVLPTNCYRMPLTIYLSFI
jgi:hypothetical protein